VWSCDSCDEFEYYEGFTADGPRRVHEGVANMEFFTLLGVIGTGVGTAVLVVRLGMGVLFSFMSGPRQEV
jgi:hypothetical protein